MTTIPIDRLLFEISARIEALRERLKIAHEEESALEAYERRAEAAQRDCEAAWADLQCTRLADAQASAEDAAACFVNPLTALGMVETIRAALPRAILVGDSTQPVYAANLFYNHDRPGGFFNAATGYSQPEQELALLSTSK